MPPHIRTCQLTMLLLKDEVTAFDEAIREDLPASVVRSPVDQALDIDGEVFVNAPRSGEPRWMDFIRQGVNVLGTMSSKHVSALILLKLHEGAHVRIMAITFGQGRYLLRQEAIVDDFGLKVVLNAVQIESLRAIDSRTISDTPRVARQNASRLSPIAEFSIDKFQDVLTKVVGVPRDTAFANSISGGTSLAIKAQISFAELPDKCLDVLRYYRSTEYTEHFGWVDNMKLVRNKNEIRDLNESLITKIRNNNCADLFLTVPEPENWDEIEGFTFSTDVAGQAPRLDLTMSDFVETVNDLTTISLDDIRRRNFVNLHKQDGTQVENRWSIYECVIWHYEPDAGDSVFILYGGTWHRLSREFVNDVNSFVREIPNSDLRLPPALARETEPAYNTRCGTQPGIYYFDRQTYETGDGRIEICDLLTPARQLVHVKRGRSSSELSHLYTQATVSAKLLLQDRACREFTREVIRRYDDHADLDSILPESKPNAGNYEIVLAVISPETHRWPVDYPFLTKLALRNACNQLQAFRTTVLHIQQPL